MKTAWAAEDSLGSLRQLGQDLSPDNLSPQATCHQATCHFRRPVTPGNDTMYHTLVTVYALNNVLLCMTLFCYALHIVHYMIVHCTTVQKKKIPIMQLLVMFRNNFFQYYWSCASLMSKSISAHNYYNIDFFWAFLIYLHKSLKNIDVNAKQLNIEVILYPMSI